MSTFLEPLRQSWLAIRWNVIVILIFWLGFIHYVVLAPESNMLKAGHRLISAAPTWEQIMEQVSWGQELDSGNSTVVDTITSGLDTSGDDGTIPHNGGESADATETPPTSIPEDAVRPSNIAAFVSAERLSQTFGRTPNIISTSSIAKPTSLPFDANGHPAGMDDGYAAICISIKDQRQDLPEFLVHHYYHLGIRHFYIMDDGSEPPLSEMEDFGIPRTALSFTYQPRATRDPRMQMVFYDNCLQERGKLHQWIAFFDADEFLEVTSPNLTFREILEEFEKIDHVGALGVNWRMHSSAGLLTRPESARKAFTTCIYDDVENAGAASDNRHIKSIVRPSKTQSHFNPHKFRMLPGILTVGEDGDEIFSIGWRPITRKRLALHHYAVKSRAEYEEKIHRGNGMTDPKGQQFWDHVETMPHVDCPEMAAYDP